MSSMTRSIKRRMARSNMERAGVTRINKRKYNQWTGTTYSYFQENWRKWV